MMEWLRFAAVALFLTASLGMAVISVAGVFKFKFILNRMHAAAICDSFVLLLAMLGVAVAYGFCAATIKVILIVLFVWIASPVSGHLIARLEVTTDKHLSEECEVRE
ncbi:MAG: cation:proton antiporter [Lachnospiraceae bacterium]